MYVTAKIVILLNNLTLNQKFFITLSKHITFSYH